MKKLFAYIEQNTLRLEASYRGGGIEIDASEYTGIDGARMTAYQNYLGGGMLGSIQGSRNFGTKNQAKLKKANRLHEALKKYYYTITNPIAEERDAWASTGSYNEQQNRPSSAY
jgi:hypothetical protein